ncbi:MAG: InlB B-repeat-containing protein [Bacteroidales bacterium]|nr:InlB B-repeat-containing protein [Bacteroidales bacterium]
MKKIFPYTLCALVALLMFSCEPLIKPQHHFSVLFDANGGDGDMDAQILAEGVLDHLAENNFQREGYTFVGWNTAPDGSGTSYDDTDLFKTDQNLTLYAQWEKLLFPLFFEANGGSGNMSAQMIKYDESTALNENTFIRGGYRFTGWNTEADGSGKAYKDKQEIVITQESYLYAQWTMLSSGTENGHSYIDLGLPSGLKWASFNLGAKTPEGSGDYFAWGETEPKKEYSWSNYEYCFNDGSSFPLTKYNTKSSSGYNGFTDNKTTLELSDDAAHVNMGGKWRMPTETEIEELINTSYCTWTWTTQNGVNGYIIESKTNGNSIFLPVAGFKDGTHHYNSSFTGEYWSSSLFTGHSGYYSNYAYSLYFRSDIDMIDYDMRSNGNTIRPVYAEFAIVTFNANGGQGEMPAQQFVIGESQALMSNAFTRAGYTFSGWNTAPDGSGTAYYNHQIISPEQNLTLYAQWEIIPAIVTFDANGGQGTMAPQIFDPTVLQALNANTFTRNGHMFAGWNTAPDGSGTPFNDQAEVMIGGDLTLYAQWYAVSGFENEHAYVDLGLPSGTKWAICNLGATAPEGYGDYFAWGETAPKSHYNWSYYKHNRRSGTVNSLLKYNNNVNNGVVDNKTTLDAEDDAATVNWGGRWRIPSQTEQNELITNCNLTWVQQKGVNGYKLTSKINGNSIFLPAAGYRYNADLVSVGTHAYYWANSLYTFSSFDAVNLYYERTLVSVGKYSSRCIGYTVRAVISDDTSQTTIYILTFNANDGSGARTAQLFEAGVTQTLTANKFTRSGYYFSGWNTAPDGSGTSYTDGQEITLTEDMTLYAQWEQEQVASGTENGHDYVDLGLPSGLKWANCNVGATSPEGYGDYFAWGETSPKDNYKWSTYKYCNGSETTLSKYNTNSSRGTVDNKTTLDISDDAARANWGGKWRMPTEAEQDELRNNCTWTWTTRNGINGYKVTSKTNGNSIFLPAAGNRLGASVGSVGSGGDYWSSSLDSSEPNYACSLYFKSSYVAWSTGGRYGGHTVRAVCP